ncbi:2OG-Fe(II) oxygenase [Novosphingobium sp. MW5]|nr:2OG-Fe(II) oxygenase [Novosphingobium sp. MW5]
MNRPLVPGHIVIDDFLPAKRLAELDAHVSAHEARLFEIAIETDVNGNGYSGSRRLWQVPEALGPCEDWFTAAVEACLPDLFAATGITPFTPARYEYELNAQFDGNFFERHIDSDFGAAAAGRISDRIVSAVFYFPRPGAKHSGGEIELFAFNGTEPAVSIAPERNRLVAFPSFAWHQVAALSAEDNGLANARLSVNCWIHKARPGAG